MSIASTPSATLVTITDKTKEIADVYFGIVTIFIPNSSLCGVAYMSIPFVSGYEIIVPRDNERQMSKGSSIGDVRVTIADALRIIAIGGIIQIYASHVGSSSGLSILRGTSSLTDPITGKVSLFIPPRHYNNAQYRSIINLGDEKIIVRRESYTTIVDATGIKTLIGDGIIMNSNGHVGDVSKIIILVDSR